MAKILVTGGAGMIGANLVRRLLSSGHQVEVVDNLWRGTRQNLVWAFGAANVEPNFTELDLSEEGLPPRLLADVDVVFHLADIVAGIQYVFGNEFAVWKKNLAINSNTLNSAINAGVGRYIYVGTACSYPVHLTRYSDDPKPLLETDVYPANPESSYGWSKLMGEYELALAEKEGLISAVTLRLHNVYGFPTELSPERSQVVPSLVRKAALAESGALDVWGSGRQRRSFVFVDDVVDALMFALDRGHGAGAIQIGPENSTSIGDLARMVIEVSDKQLSPRFDPTKPEGDGERVADISKARKILGWHPKTPLAEGIGSLYRWAQTSLRVDDE